MSCGHGRTGEREGLPMPLSPDDPLVAIDPRLATRRAADRRAPPRRTRSSPMGWASRRSGSSSATTRAATSTGRAVRRSGTLQFDQYVDRDRDGAVGQQAADPPAPDDGHGHAVDGTGYLDLTFFNQPWTATSTARAWSWPSPGSSQIYRGRLQLANQEVEVLRERRPRPVHTGRITPVHPATEGVTTADDPRAASTRARAAAARSPTRSRPRSRDAEALSDDDRALRWIHFPEDRARAPGRAASG